MSDPCTFLKTAGLIFFDMQRNNNSYDGDDNIMIRIWINIMHSIVSQLFGCKGEENNK